MSKKVLFWGPAPWGMSAYSRIIGNLGPLLAKEHEVAYFSYTHIVETYGIEFQGRPVFCSHFGFAENHKHFIDNVVNYYKPDVVLQVFDLFTTWPASRGYIEWPMITYAPQDSIPMAEICINSAKLASIVVPQTEFAKLTYELAGIKTTEPIYHGVDSQIYHPQDKSLLRRKFKIADDAFVVLMVQDNTRRKNIPSQIAAWLNFKRATKANTILIGVIPNFNFQREWDINELWKTLCPDKDEQKSFRPSFGLPEANLAEFYAVSDVLLQGVHSEGFGLPIIEAGATGIPTIGTDYGGITELIKGRGWLIPGELTYYQPEMNIWQLTPSQLAMTRALIDAYEHPDKRQQFGDAMLNFVQAECDWNKLAEKWLKVILSIS